MNQLPQRHRVLDSPLYTDRSLYATQLTQEQHSLNSSMSRDRLSFTAHLAPGYPSESNKADNNLNGSPSSGSSADTQLPLSPRQESLLRIYVSDTSVSLNPPRQGLAAQQDHPAQMRHEQEPLTRDYNDHHTSDLSSQTMTSAPPTIEVELDVRELLSLQQELQQRRQSSTSAVGNETEILTPAQRRRKAQNRAAYVLALSLRTRICSRTSTYTRTHKHT